MAKKREKFQDMSLTAHQPPALQTIDFHGHDLYSLKDDRDGKTYVLPKRFCEIFRLSWQGQLAKLTRNALFRQGIKKIMLPSASGEQETVILDLELLHAWLLSISLNRVEPDVQEMLLTYQQECATALHDYWMKGVAVNHRRALDHFPELRAIVELAETTAQARLLAEEAKAEAHKAEVRAALAEAKADLAIEDGKRMTIEEFVLKNGLLRQLPVSEWRSMAAWLTHFCHAHNLAIQKQPVPGKLWPDENSYPLAAFGAWRQAYQQRWHQIPLVEEDALVYADTDGSPA